LVDEMFKQLNKTITVIFGNPIPYQTFDSQYSNREWTVKVKKHVYAMGKQQRDLPFFKK